MKSDIDFKNTTTALGNFFQRFHSIIFFGVIGIALAVALLIVVNTLTTSGNGNSGNQQLSSSDSSSSFDKNTINTLRQSQNPSQSSLSIPSGRINPFE